MADGVAFLFEEKGWIDKLNEKQKKNPYKSLKFDPKLKDLEKDPKKFIDPEKLIKTKITYHGKPLSFDMRVILLAWKLRNYAAHNIEKQQIFVKKFSKIVEWLLFAVFIAVSTLPKPSKGNKKLKIKSHPRPSYNVPIGQTIALTSNLFTLNSSGPLGENLRRDQSVKDN